MKEERDRLKEKETFLNLEITKTKTNLKAETERADEAHRLLNELVDEKNEQLKNAASQYEKDRAGYLSKIKVIEDININLKNDLQKQNEAIKVEKVKVQNTQKQLDEVNDKVTILIQDEEILKIKIDGKIKSIM